MYYYIRGKLAKKDENFVVVDANGVGYKIFTSAYDINKAGEAGSEITMYTYLHVREDIMDLYGFITIEEKNMFICLISVSGVGPKAALAILSVATPASFAAAVITNDVKAITKAAGVGPKLAQRVILELRDKIKKEQLGIDISAEEDIGGEDTVGAAGEAVSALVVLGYALNDAKRAVAKTDMTKKTEEIVKQALKKLG